MIERFEGDESKRRLIEEFCRQKIVLGNKELALELAQVSELKELNEGDILVKQNCEDTEIYFVIVGSFAIEANGRQVAIRKAGTHVGEMALIDTTAVRSASIVAASKSVVAMVSEPNFSQVANKYPELWRQVAIELCERLRNRNNFIQPPNVIPNIFICSSSESLPYAEAIRLGLDHHDSEVTLWTDQVFNPSAHTMEDLEREVGNADFGIALVMPEDLVNSRDRQSMAPRDNVVFELGLFMGRLGRARTVIVSPRGIDLKLPSDVHGLTTLLFKPPNNVKDSAEMTRALGGVITQLKTHIDKFGPL